MSKSAQCQRWGMCYGQGKGLRVLADGKVTASAAHVYDKRLVDARAFTTWRRWIDGPLDHKRFADRALGEGLNCLSLHTFASSPPEAGLPGWAYHAGTDFNPSAT